MFNPTTHAAAALFLSVFFAVFCLGLQSQLVNNGHYWPAAINSLAIGTAHLALYKLAPDASGFEIAAYLIGGPLAIVASMWMYRSHAARRLRRGNISQARADCMANGMANDADSALAPHRRPTNVNPPPTQPRPTPNHITPRPGNHFPKPGQIVPFPANTKASAGGVFAKSSTLPAAAPSTVPFIIMGPLRLNRAQARKVKASLGEKLDANKSQVVLIDRLGDHHTIINSASNWSSRTTRLLIAKDPFSGQYCALDSVTGVIDHNSVSTVLQSRRSRALYERLIKMIDADDSRRPLAHQTNRTIRAILQDNGILVSAPRDRVLYQQPT